MFTSEEIRRFIQDMLEHLQEDPNRIIKANCCMAAGCQNWIIVTDEYSLRAFGASDDYSICVPEHGWIDFYHPAISIDWDTVEEIVAIADKSKVTTRSGY